MKILIAEDDPSLRRLLVALPEKAATAPTRWRTVWKLRNICGSAAMTG